MTVGVRVKRGDVWSPFESFADEHLQVIMDRAAKAFFDPDATPTPPLTDRILEKYRESNAKKPR